MESQHTIYFFGRCLLLLHAILSRSSLVVDAGAEDMTTTLPPNFVPVNDGATGVRPADLPEILTAPDAKGEICTLASLEATVVIWPEGDESRQEKILLPDGDATVSTVQNCHAATNPSSPKPILVITWLSSFQLCFYIFKDEKNWTVNQIVFAFNVSSTPLDNPKSEWRMFGSEANALKELQAPLGLSYRCYTSKEFPFLPLGRGGGAVVAGRNSNNNSNIQPASDNATLIFSNFQLQPFVENQKVFGDEVICKEDFLSSCSAKRRRRRRDSSVTIAVGSSLAVVSVVTVMGYAIFRYVKIKAVGYDTME